MLVVFHPLPGGGTRTVLHRADHVLVELRSYDQQWRVPHDLAHAVTERELRMSGGMFGCLAAGALYDSATVVAGRSRYDARERSRRLLAAHAGEIAVAEILSAVVHRAVEQAVEHDIEHRGPAPYPEAVAAWGVLREDPFPYTEMDVQRATSTLTRLADAWLHLPPHEGLRFDWPRRLTAAPPPRPKPPRRPGSRRVR